jgi:hypothetical protein
MVDLKCKLSAIFFSSMSYSDLFFQVCIQMDRLKVGAMKLMAAGVATFIGCVSLMVLSSITMCGVLLWKV